MESCKAAFVGRTWRVVTEFFCRDMEEAGVISVKKVSTLDISSDVLTKPAESRAKLVRALGKHGFVLPGYQRKLQQKKER